MNERLGQVWKVNWGERIEFYSIVRVEGLEYPWRKAKYVVMNLETGDLVKLPARILDEPILPSPIVWTRVS